MSDNGVFIQVLDSDLYLQVLLVKLHFRLVFARFIDLFTMFGLLVVFGPELAPAQVEAHL